MEAPVIHLTTCDSFQEIAQADHSQHIIDAFVESCKALDASIFEPYMDEENVFEDKNKYLFLASMKELFDTFKNKKAVSIHVKAEDGACKGCQFGKYIKMFTVRGFGRMLFTYQFAYRIEVKKGVLLDIYRCNYFATTGELPSGE